jgi:hypothetical protein
MKAFATASSFRVEAGRRGDCLSSTARERGGGAVRHPDHATIVLRDWHRVLMNTEHRAEAMRHVAFLD